MIDLKKEIRFIKGVGEARAKNFQKLGLKTVEDLVFYYPRDYRDFSKIIKIKEAKINQKIAVKTKVQEIKNRPTRRRRFVITEVLVSDDTGTLKVLWFNQPYLLNNIKPKDEVLLAGNLELEKELVLKNPEYEVVKNESYKLRHLGRISPIYRESASITSRWLRFILRPVLENLEIADYLPEEVKRSQNITSLKQALFQIHFPKDFENLKKARKRLSFDEVFIPQILSILIRRELKKEKSHSIKTDLSLLKNLKDSLPFVLTNSQRKAIWQIVKDLKKENPMNRLLEGDVGSGKTVVAAFVLMLVAKRGFQGVLMVPTEILAWEHLSKIKDFLKNFDVTVEILTGSTKAGDKKEILKKLEEGEIDILIGTHALIGEKLEFKNLALAVIDEQHRFGVEQRKALKEKSSKGRSASGGNRKISPHFLSMTATPIPRTVSLTVYGDLDISVLKEMPQGERKVKTFLVPSEKRFKAYQFIKEHIRKGEQALVICPTILKSDKLGVKAVLDEHKKLKESIFLNYKMGLLHGKIKSEEKKEIMNDFRKGLIKILISTSVVEVGINIPRLSIMMVENADRFGLAQLHQLRGRIGRAGQESFFLLFTDSKNPETLERLEAMSRIKDGFKLAEYDLLLRGPGEILGIKQSGYTNFKLASFTDYELISQAKKEAEKLINHDPTLEKFPALLEKVKKIKKVVHPE